MKNRPDLNMDRTVTVRRSTIVVAALAGVFVIQSMRRNAFVDGYLTAVETVLEAAPAVAG